MKKVVLGFFILVSVSLYAQEKKVAHASLSPVWKGYNQDNFYDHKVTSKEQKIEYLVSLPADYNRPDKKHPLLLFLHGGDGSNTKHHPKKYAMKAALDFPFIVIAPHSAKGISWNTIDHKKLLDEVGQNYQVDFNRIYVTGYSYGGYGTWTALIKYPDLFAAAVPICGGGDPSKICAAKNIAVKAYHAKDDNVTPYAGSVKMVEAMKKCAADASLKTAETGGHGIWPFIYSETEVLYMAFVT